MNAARRLAVPVAQPIFNANIRRRYDIEGASWIWHPARPAGQVAALRFVNEFRLDAASDVVLHVSADQRYELSLDGELMCLGPNRSDVQHWSFASCAVRLTAGRHRLEALAWWIGRDAPAAQLSWRGGFVLAAEGLLSKLLNTGLGDWTVTDLDGWSFDARRGELPAHMVGGHHTLDGRRLFGGQAVAVAPAVVVGPLVDSEWSTARSGWQLHPSPLPDQLCRVIRPGRIIAVIDGGLDGERPLLPEHLRHVDIPAWQRLVEDGQGLTVEPGRTVSALWDLEDYYCGYSQATLSEGAGGELSLTWAEALFEQPVSRWSKHKGSRKELLGKFYRGPRDSFINDGGAGREYRACWWRSGRYVLLSARAGDSPLRIDAVAVRETRYPLEDESRFDCDDGSVRAIVPFGLRGLAMCSHETFMDCPHYEQVQYVGDTRLQMLATFCLTRDDRLCRRAVQLFDWSRCMHGFVNSSYPAGPQMISTFPLYWVLMVRDLAFWRDDPALVGELMVGLRACLEQYQHLRRADRLLHDPPGWPFVDTVPEWIGTLYGPDPAKGPSAIVNLLYVYALQHAAELEDCLGEPELARRDRRLAGETARAVLDRFWVVDRALLADDAAKAAFSEHAQCLALLTDILPRKSRPACLKALLTAPDLARCQPMHWMFYYFELCHKFGLGDVLLSRLGTWNELMADGFKTPPEMFEPSRSDCHGWGSHPIFHFHATLAGIRPTAPGFSAVEIAPSPGRLKWIETRTPHPRGFIETRLEFDKGRCRAGVSLPNGVSGVFRWRRTRRPLLPGRQEFTL